MSGHILAYAIQWFDCVGVSGLVKVKVCPGVRGLFIVVLLSGKFNMKSFPAFENIP